MLCLPAELASLGFIQSKGLPLNSCTPPVPMFVKSLEPEQTDIWLSAMRISSSTGTCTAKESSK